MGAMEWIEQVGPEKTGQLWGQARRLWKEVFSEQEEFLCLFEAQALRRSTLYCVREQGEILSSLFILELPARRNGVMVRAGYLYAAATNKDFRGRGYFSALYRFAAQREREKGTVEIYCVPAQESLFSFYARFGFVRALARTKITVQSAGRWAREPQTHRAEPGDLITACSLDQAYQIYAQCMEKQDGPIKDRAWFHLAAQAAGVRPFRFQGGYLLLGSGEGQVEVSIAEAMVPGTLQALETELWELSEHSGMPVTAYTVPDAKGLAVGKREWFGMRHDLCPEEDQAGERPVAYGNLLLE